MKSFLYLLLLLCVLFAPPAIAQIGMGGTPHPSAVLDLQATNKAFYPPRLTTAQRKAIANPQPGAFVFDGDQNTFYLFDGHNWLPLAFQNPANLLPATRTASDGVAYDNFGISVSISGDYALVGALQDNIGANNSQGSVYVFVRNGGSWTQQAKLTANDGTGSDLFGRSVSIAGDYALVGAIGDNSNQGSAYVFLRTGTTWTQQAKITASDGTATDNFGSSVSLSGDYALVGAALDDNGANIDQGSAYMFLRSGSTWTQQAKLMALDGGGGENFGYSLSLSGDYALVGAYKESIGANANQGAAYVFLRNGAFWNQQFKLTANDGTAADFFGYSVALSGDYALVGSPLDGAGIGAAYVFFRAGFVWSPQAKLTASDGVLGDRFGSSVAISGDYALVGAAQDEVGSNNAQGSAYVFKRTGSNWSQVRQVVDNAPANTSNGYSVGISNGSFIIGGPTFETNKGKVAFGIVEN